MLNYLFWLYRSGDESIDYGALCHDSQATEEIDFTDLNESLPSLSPQSPSSAPSTPPTPPPLSPIPGDGSPRKLVIPRKSSPPPHASRASRCVSSFCFPLPKNSKFVYLFFFRNTFFSKFVSNKHFLPCSSSSVEELVDLYKPAKAFKPLATSKPTAVQAPSLNDDDDDFVPERPRSPKRRSDSKEPVARKRSASLSEKKSKN